MAIKFWRGNDDDDDNDDDKQENVLPKAASRFVTNWVLFDWMPAYQTIVNTYVILVCY